jgi:hypothetical protein
MSQVYYVEDKGYTPNYSQMFSTCELVEKSGKPTWKITIHTLEEINDGSEKYQNLFQLIINKKISIIAGLQNNTNLWSKLNEASKHNLTVYKTQLSSIVNFPKGFVIPELPVCDLSVLPPNAIRGL